jgi:hypothetical protein
MIHFPVESDPVVSADGWTLTVEVTKIEETPGGSKHVRQREKYNYKAAAPDEDKHMEQRRLDVKRNAKARCLIKFDPVKTAAKKAKRAKGARAVAEAGPPPQQPQFVLPAASPAVVAPTSRADPMHDCELDVVTARDWALLRAWKVEPGPEAVLRALRERGLDDAEEAWSVARVVARHEFLCRCVRVASRMVGETGSMRTVRTLARLCE